MNLDLPPAPSFSISSASSSPCAPTCPATSASSKSTARVDLTQFDAFISSAREGLRKPDPRIYLRACQCLGVPPAQCLFMDDSLDNVRAAQQTGMQALHWPDHATGWRAFQDWQTSVDE